MLCCYIIFLYLKQKYFKGLFYLKHKYASFHFAFKNIQKYFKLLLYAGL